MPRLRQTDRDRAVTLLMRGISQSEVSRRLGVNHSTISRLWQRLRRTGNTADRPRSGRPRVTTARQDRQIRLTHLRDRFQTATETALNTPGTHNNRIHPQTVINRLREFGIRARRPYVGTPLTARRRAIRLNWLERHRPINFPRRRWCSVLFSDESRFSLHRADGRQRVYRRRGERYADACIIERDRFGGGSVMVWGSIAHGYKSPLVVVDGTMTAVKYRDEILAPHVVPITQQRALTFQHDNARPHVARICTEFLAQNNVDVMDWPPYSPDFSPIEHLWDELDRRVRRRVNIPRTLQELSGALTEEWNNIPVYKINRLIGSMGSRIREGLNARGGHTRY